MSRRSRIQPDFPSGPDPVVAEVERITESWRADDRALLDELLEDAGSELQREMILRAAAARHTPAELHAFADTLRAMRDAEVFDACTISARTDVPVTSRLRAEADPLFALELNGVRLSPRLEDDPGPAYDAVDAGRPRPRFKPPPALFVQPLPPSYTPAKKVYEEESSTARGQSLSARRELGESAPEPSFRKEPVGDGADVPALNEAVKGMGVTFREHRVDVGAFTLEKALELATSALGRGIPVPVTLGRKAGDLGRQALILQVSPPGRARAFQLHDPFAQETVWANERDLLGRAELPFDAKIWRRITAIALPVQRAR